MSPGAGGRATRVLVLAGLEPTGRAGLLADLATLREQGGVGVGIATALTAQGVRTFASRPTPPALLRQQIAAVLELGRVDAVKLGMVPDRAALRAIVEGLAGLEVPWVVDPVVRTSAGQALSRLGPRDYLRLAAGRVALTPNLDEAAWLLGREEAGAGPAWAGLAAERLAAAGFGGVVIKGGHRARGAIDTVWARGRLSRLEGPRLARRREHRGTGCRFASALALEWARGGDLARAAARAKAVVARYLRSRG